MMMIVMKPDYELYTQSSSSNISSELPLHIPQSPAPKEYTNIPNLALPHMLMQSQTQKTTSKFLDFIDSIERYVSPLLTPKTASDIESTQKDREWFLLTWPSLPAQQH